MPKRVALYARFSSDLQNPRSAADQIAALHADLARRQPTWRIVVEEVDEGVSGTSMEGRSGLKRLLALAAQRPVPFDAVIVEDLSRFARNRGDSIRLRETFTGHGVAVLAASDGYVDPDSEAGLFLTGFKELKAEADSRETGRRVRRGVKARTERGWVSGRRAPFGYRRKPVFSQTERDRDGRPIRLGIVLEPDPAAASAVRFMFAEYAAGLGMRRLIKRLNDPVGPYHALKPAGFSTSFLRSLLLNPTYAGRLVYARTRERKVRVGESTKRRKTVLPESDWAVHEAAHEALVDPATWARVQAMFFARRGTCFGRSGTVQTGGRPPASLLSGIVRCAGCGNRFVVWTSGRNPRQRAHGTGQTQRRFVCGRRLSTHGAGCTNTTSLEVRGVETRVLDTLEQSVLTEESFRYLEARRRELLLEALASDGDQDHALREEEARLRVEETRLVDAVKAGLALGGLRQEAERIQARLTAIDASLRQAERRVGIDRARVDDHLARERLASLREILGAEDLSQVRAALKEVVVAAEVASDGTLSLLLGEGVLGSTDLEGTPQRATGAASEPALPRTNCATPGLPPGSRICVVGATGFEPATS